MSSRTAVLFFCCCAPLLVGAAPGSRSYTNEDLERVAPYRGQTGVDSTTADPEPAPESRPAGSSRARRSGSDVRLTDDQEGYWRREAKQVRQRTRKLDARAATLRRRIEAQQQRPGTRPYTDPVVVELERQLSELLAERRELEDELDDRARRARALPGWLR